MVAPFSCLKLPPRSIIFGADIHLKICSSLEKINKVVPPPTKTYISFMLNQEEYFSNSVRHAVNGVIQCTSAGGGSCEKAIGVGFVGGAAVGAGAAATGGLAAGGATAVFGTGSAATVGSAVVGGAVGGAVSGAGNYATQSLVNGGFNSGDLWESTWKGAAAGAVGGGAGAWGSGALASMSGGFAGGVTGSALNGGEGWDVLKGGLMGSGMALASYAMVWGYNNYGSEISTNKDYKRFEGEAKQGNNEPTNEYIEEARGMLEARRQIYIEETNGINGADLNPYDVEVGGSFRVRQTFWTGKDYLAMTSFETGGPLDVGFSSKNGDLFRMHLHTPSRTIEINDPINGYNKYIVNQYKASQGDVSQSNFYMKHGIRSYFSTTDSRIYRVGNGTYHEVY